jgi:hypothetical protein
MLGASKGRIRLEGSKEVREVCVQEVRWDKGCTERAEVYTIFYGEGNEDQIRIGFV